jgi:hypothetical protein
MWFSMFSIAWVALFVYLVVHSTVGVETHLRWKHALAVAFLVLCFQGVVKELGWLVGHPTQINRIVDFANPPIPPAISLLFFFGNMTFGLVTVVLCYFLSRCYSQARPWLLRILPVLYLITAFEFFASFNRETAGSKVVPAIAIALVLIAIPYLLIYRFYSNTKVVAGLRLAAIVPPG